jgi:hypothetical protein
MEALTVYTMLFMTVVSAVGGYILRNGMEKDEYGTSYVGLAVIATALIVNTILCAKMYGVLKVLANGY